MDLTREQLYEMLWTDGVGKTEKALGLKQQELHKLCGEYNIPKPPSTYWTGIIYDRNPQKTPLPPSDKEGPIHTEDYIKRRRKKIAKPVQTTAPADTAAGGSGEPSPAGESKPGKYPPRELPQEEPATIYTVPEKLIAKDPVILDTKAKLREQNYRKDNPWSKKNPYKNTPDKWLDITVSQEQEDRALRVFSTIWKAAEAKGYHLKITKSKNIYYPSCTSYFLVRNYEIRVQLKEINRRIPGEKPFESSTLVGSGRLKFVCDRGDHCYSWNHERCAAQDTEHTSIEDKIERIIEVLGEIADERDQAEVERKLAEERRKQEEERKRQEEEKKRLEAEEQARIEERRNEERGLLRKLLFNADRARAAAMIRDYAAQFEETMAGKMEDEELKKQVQWIREKADFIDPFIKRNDEWLLPSDIGRLLNPEITKTTEEHRSSYGYGHETTYSYWQIRNMWGHGN